MSEFPNPERDVAPSPTGAPQTAVLAGGCFWCTGAVFVELDGVLEVTSGYVGDRADKADYETVCSGTTAHAEAVRVRFDPAKLSFGQLFPCSSRSRTIRRSSIARATTWAVSTARRSSPSTRSRRHVAEAYIRQLDAARVFARADRDAHRAELGVLRRGGLPPELRGAESAPAVHRGDRAAEGGEAAQAVRRSG